ncbi:hypothetical protein KKI19_00625 [Patescibacteria group bacterium]|nr:hypothetical protein [Patescibacteria group bacterium]
MKILGHAYIATRAVDGDNQLLIAGAFLPEMLPYIPNDVFEYKEFHEGGRKLLEYLNKNYPEKRDLALGLLSYGVEFGADKFGKESEQLVGEKRSQLLREISEANSVSREVAKIRLHNYVGLAIDWLLVQNEPELVKEVQKILREVDIKEISHLLAEEFKKNETKVRVMVETLFKNFYRPEDLTSAEGLARIWARQVSGLPEKDKVDIQKASELIQDCADLLEGNWRSFLESTRIRVKENLQPFITGKKAQ